MRNISVRTPVKDNDGEKFVSKRIFIAGREDNSTRITFDGLNSGKISALNCTEAKSVFMNSALLLEDTLDKIVEEAIDIKRLTDPIVIYLPGVFLAKLQNGDYLKWIMTGLNNDEEVMGADELDLWTSIEKLLAQTHSFVALKNISSAKFSGYAKGGRRNKPTWLQSKDNELQSMAWNRVPGGSDTQIEEEVAEEA